MSSVNWKWEDPKRKRMQAWLIQRRKSSYPDHRDSKVEYSAHLGMLH